MPLSLSDRVELGLRLADLADHMGEADVPLLTAADVGVLAGLSIRTIRALPPSVLPRVQVGRAVRFRFKDVCFFVRQHRVPRELAPIRRRRR